MDIFIDFVKLYKRIFKGKKYEVEKIFEELSVESIQLPKKGQEWSLGEGYQPLKILDNDNGKVIYYSSNKDTVLIMDESNFMYHYTKC